MEDKDLSALMMGSQDLPEGRSDVHKHEAWRDIAALAALIALEEKRRNPSGGYPIKKIMEAAEEEYGLQVSRDSMTNFVRNTVENLIVTTTVPTEWHRKMALQAQGRLDTIGMQVELVNQAREHLKDVMGRRGIITYDAEDNAIVETKDRDVVDAMKAYNSLNKELHGMLGSIGWAPKEEKKGIEVNFQNFHGGSGRAFPGFGSAGRVINSE